MLNFLREEYDYKETFLIYSKILKKLEKEGSIEVKNFIKNTTPVTRENIMDSLSEIISHSKKLTDIISEDLGINVFESLIDLDYSKCIILEEGIIYNNVYYSLNPYSRKAFKIREELKNKKDLSISEFGVVSKQDYLKVKDNFKKLKNSIINSLDIDKKIQELFSLAINSKAEKIKISPSNDFIEIEFLKNGGYIKTNLELGEISNYQEIIDYIYNRFEELTVWKHNEENYKIILSKEDYSLNNNFYSILYFSIYFGKSIMTLEDFNIPFKEKELFKQSITSPSGIILISGAMESGKRERLYGILNWIKLNYPQLNITTIEDVVKKELDLISQFETGLSKNFKYEKFNSNVLGFHEIKSKKDVEYVMSEASKGKLVIAGINSLNSLNAISKILSFNVNKKLFSELLLSVIHSNLILKVCPYCSSEYKFLNDPNYQVFVDLENAPLPHETIRKSYDLGCYHCLEGYKDKILVTEFLENDLLIKEEILNNFNIEKIKLEKRSASWKNCFESGIEGVKEGDITINSLINSLGYYKK